MIALSPRGTGVRGIEGRAPGTLAEAVGSGNPRRPRRSTFTCPPTRGSMTFDRYGHLMPGNETEAADLLNAYLARASDPEIGGEA